jgi:hypothetical protein
VSKLSKVSFIELPTVAEAERGRLTVIQGQQHVPFPIARIFYLYGIPDDCDRGAHAHRETEQAFVAVSGSFVLDLTDGPNRETFTLCEPNRAVYVPAMIWARLHSFSADAVCLVLASTDYDPEDYIRNWDEYTAALRDPNVGSNNH